MDIKYYHTDNEKKKLDSNRPIFLTSVLCDVSKRIIGARLNWEVKSGDMLCSQQYGSRSGRSTQDQFLLLQNAIKNYFTTKRDLLAAFFNFSQSFNTINTSHSRIPRTTAKLYSQFFDKPLIQFMART